MAKDNKSLEPLFNDDLSDPNAADLKRDLRVKSALDPVEGYHISDQEVGTTSFYGYQNKTGAYYIQKGIQTGAEINYTYTSGNSGYAAAWTNRTTESYQRFADEF